MIWRWNLHPLTSLAEVQNALEAHSGKPWVTNLSIVLQTLGILTASVSCCIIFLEYINKSQVNAHAGSIELLLPLCHIITISGLCFLIQGLQYIFLTENY